MENNSKLLNLEESSARDVLLAKLANMSTEELANYSFNLNTSLEVC